MNRWCRLAALAALAHAWVPAFAATPWTIESGHSRLGFAATWEGTPFEGVFQRFRGAIDFDRADLAGSRFDVQVDLASADTRSADRDEALAGSEWFFTRRYPEATYVASAFRELGGGRFEAQGALTLKGVTRPVVLPFTWTEAGDVATLKGETRLMRTDFNVGEGEWKAGDVIGLEVRVVVELRLRRASGPRR